MGTSKKEVTSNKPNIKQHQGTTLNEKDFVVNHEAYEEWKRLLKHPILNEKRNVDTSDGVTIDLALVPMTFKARVAHLPVLERAKLTSLKKVFQSINGRTGMLKQKAFGYSNTPKGRKKGSMNSTTWSNPSDRSVLRARKAEVIELFSRMFTQSDVKEILFKQWNLNVHKESIQHFYATHIDEILKGIEVHKSSFGDLRLGVKRSRLEEYTWIYGQAKKRYGDSKSREDLRTMMECLERVKKEVEGEKLVFEGSIDMNMDEKLSAYVQQSVFKSMSLNQIILSRIAAKLGVPPIDLLTKFTKSYYSHLTGIVKPIAISEYENIQYPSHQNYDFDKIEAKARAQEYNRLLTSKEPIEVEVVEDPKKVAMRQAIMKLMSDKVEDLQKSRSAIDAISHTSSPAIAGSEFSPQLRPQNKKESIKIKKKK